MVTWAINYNEVRLGTDRPKREGGIHSSDPVVRIAVYSAMNGRILEMVKPNYSQPTNDVKLMLVPEGENLSATVAVMLLAEGMK